MAVDPRTGQTIIDPIASQFLLSARKNPAPGVAFGGLAPIAETAAGLFREKRARDDMKALADERAKIIGGADFNNPDSLFSVAMQLQMRGGEDDMQAANQLLRMGGLRQDMTLADRADARAEKSLNLQAAGQAFSQRLQSAQFSFDQDMRKKALGLKVAQFKHAQEAAKNARTPEEQAALTERAKAAEKDARQVNRITGQLKEFVALSRELTRLGRAIPSEKRSTFETVTIGLAQALGNYTNFANEPPEVFSKRILDKANSIISGQEGSEGFAKGVAVLIGMSPEERQQFFETKSVDVLLGGGTEKSAQPAQPAAQTGQAPTITGIRIKQ